MKLIRTHFFSDNVLKALARELHHFQLSKALMDWDLEDLEEVSCLVDDPKSWIIPPKLTHISATDR